MCFSTSKIKKKRSYKNFDETKTIMDDKLFWKTIKASLSDTLVARGRIHLTEKDETVKTELETADINQFLLQM